MPYLEGQCIALDPSPGFVPSMMMRKGFRGAAKVAARGLSGLGGLGYTDIVALTAALSADGNYSKNDRKTVEKAIKANKKEKKYETKTERKVAKEQRKSNVKVAKYQSKADRKIAKYESKAGAKIAKEQRKLGVGQAKVAGDVAAQGAASYGVDPNLLYAQLMQQQSANAAAQAASLQPQAQPSVYSGYAGGGGGAPSITVSAPSSSTEPTMLESLPPWALPAGIVGVGFLIMQMMTAKQKRRR